MRRRTVYIVEHADEGGAFCFAVVGDAVRYFFLFGCWWSCDAARWSVFELFELCAALQSLGTAQPGAGSCTALAVAAVGVSHTARREAMQKVSLSVTCTA